MSLSEEMKSGAAGGRGHSMAKWFRSHTDKGKNGPMGVCESFLKMRAEGKTGWSVARLLKEIRRHFDFPFTSEPALSKFLSETWPELYERGIQK